MQIGRLSHRIFPLTLAAVFSFNTAAAPRTIPSAPSAPPSMTQAVPKDQFRCQRTFVHQGKTLVCDDNVERDGENLRPILKDVPAALSELNEYQQTRRKLNYVAYAVSGAILIALGGYIATRTTGGLQFKTDSGEVNAPYLVLAGGLTLAVGAFTYGFVMHQRNETRLTSAVSTYNTAKPDTPIQLEFRTGFHF